MDIQERLKLSYYKNVANINSEHDIFLVQNTEDNKFYVKKELQIYNKSVYETLKAKHVPHTPFIYEVVENDNTLIVVEEYISGNTLEEELKSGRKFSQDEIMQYAIMLCDIVSHLHSFSPAIIHRDIKPSNVIITPDNEITLLDMNAAKCSDVARAEDTVLIGTKGYAAPEQYGFGVSTKATDVYAIGVLINTLLVGHQSIDCVDESALGSIVKKCIQINPADRYQSADEIKNDLLAASGGAVLVHKKLRPPSKWAFPGFRTRKKSNMIIATIGYLLALFFGFVGFWPRTVNNTSISLLVLVLLSEVAVILTSANYMNIHSRLPILKTVTNKWFKLAAIALWDMIIVAVLVLAVSIVSGIVELF